MTEMPDFQTFFQALWGYGPFPWQSMLAERIANGTWPPVLDLPTAAGKTACMDAAIYALACQADKSISERTAPRRIWFVVDRRIVVDEAYDRATVIAAKLREATEGPIKDVADRLQRVSGTTRPLAVARLRGGVLRDEGWARLPSQPAIITSTVDQIGSRILFRGYGRSNLSAPIFAGLAAHDSLIVLDEAHCSVPFLQTLRSIEKYRGEDWAELPLRTPFAFTTLSATPPDAEGGAVFPGTKRAEALDHPILRDRISASKPAELVLAKAGRGQPGDPLVVRAAERAWSFIGSESKKRVAIIVNRVHTAEEIQRTLMNRVPEGLADVVLLTGRMRPFERDRLVAKWKPFLRAASADEPERPILFVSTQCIEVGADFSFDALVTECASLDALRQRFGRLNRMGIPGATPATILIREEDSKDGDPDPVYGRALSNTWSLLDGKASIDNGTQSKTIDFGFEAIDILLKDIDDLTDFLAPRPDAPVLFPAHLDLLCQTAPTPQPEPDIQIYLHGKDRGSPEVQVVWRCDLSEREAESCWKETIALCPPSSGEMLTVPLYRLRKWLSAPDDLDRDGADVEGSVALDSGTLGRIRSFLVWRGRDHSRLCHKANEIRPNDIIILPANYGIAGLGQALAEHALGEHALDLWELARITAGRAPALRLTRSVLEPWLACPPLRDLIDLAEGDMWEREALQEAIAMAHDYEPAADDAPSALPDWLRKLLGATIAGRPVEHPAGGLIIFTSTKPAVVEPDLFADDDDLTCALTPAGRNEVTLEQHSLIVRHVLRLLAPRCLSNEFCDSLQFAAYWHDVGKLDERFQILLHQGDEVAAATAAAMGIPLAKSADLPLSPARRKAIRKSSGIPENFRHEMLSLQLAQRHAPLPTDEHSALLVLHLIASHHGHARPFAPVSPDPDTLGVCGQLGEVIIDLPIEERSKLIPQHCLRSGLSERFWLLTRQYGWWGLAYLEAILRLGDWYGSEFVISDEAIEL